MDESEIADLYKVAGDTFDFGRFGRCGLSREDSIQEAVLRYLKVKDRFDPARGKLIPFQIAVCRNEYRRLRRKFLAEYKPMSMTMDTGIQMDVAEDIRKIILSTPLSPDKLCYKEPVLELYKKGLHNANIARRLGIDASTVTRTLQKAGIEKHDWERGWLDRDEIIEMARAGATLKEIAAEIGCHPNSAARVLSRAGLMGLRKLAAKKKALDLLQAGKPLKYIADAVGFSSKSVSRWFQEAAEAKTRGIMSS